MTLKKVFREAHKRTINELRTHSGMSEGVDLKLKERKETFTDIICSHCKESVHDTDKYCRKCGKRLGLVK